MRPYSQKDPRWKDKTIGKTSLKLETHGCFVVSLASLLEKEPGEVVDILNRNNAFNEQGGLYSDIAAQVLGLSYRGKGGAVPGFAPCLAETDHFKGDGYKQHFFVWLGKTWGDMRNEAGIIMDPLDGLVKANPYGIVSYRKFMVKTKIEPATPAEAKTPPDEDNGSLSDVSVAPVSDVKEEAKASHRSKSLGKPGLWERAVQWLKTFLRL